MTEHLLDRPTTSTRPGRLRRRRTPLTALRDIAHTTALVGTASNQHRTEFGPVRPPSRR